MGPRIGSELSWGHGFSRVAVTGMHSLTALIELLASLTRTLSVAYLPPSVCNMNTKHH